MDQALSSLLFPAHQIGSDGFHWWIGQIESNRNDDPKKSGRYKVRIVGQHLKDCNATKSSDLPWATVMMPVTSPFTDGGTTGGTVNLQLGNWVVGFYLDNDQQKPIIMGSVGHTAGATLKTNVEKDPAPNSTCKSFTTFLDPKADPYKHSPLPESDKQGGDSAKDGSKYTKVGEAGLPAVATDTPPAAFYGLFAENTATNPTGSKVCVEIANPKCGSESDLKGGLTNILGGMLAANQQSGGQLGDYYVSKVNGELTRYIDNGMEYVNKAIRLVTSFMSRVKGEIVKLIREGVDKLVDLLLTEEVLEKDALGNVNTGPVNPDLGIKPFTPITKKQSRIKPVLDAVNKVLEDLGCSIADITDRIAQWLTDLLLGYLMDAYNAAACLVDSLVEGIINQILSFIEDLLANILGPLQELLSIIADPLNLVGSAINAVFELLGISCDGPGSQCEKVTKECTDCGTEKKEDWLDELLAALEDGPTADGSVCEEAQQYPIQKSTTVVAVGGIQTGVTTTTPPASSVSGSKVVLYQCTDTIVVEGRPAVFKIIRSGNTTVSSSINYSVFDGTATLNTDYIPTGGTSTSGTLGFAPGETTKTLSFSTLQDTITEQTETFGITLSEGTTPADMTAIFLEGTTFTCEILEYSFANVGGTTPTTPTTPISGTSNSPTGSNSTNTQSVSTKDQLPNSTPKLPIYTVKANKTNYNEGEIITFTITTVNVNNNAEAFYTISGTNISQTDIVGGALTGSFRTLNAKATVNVTLATNDDIGQVEWASNQTYAVDALVYVGTSRYQIVSAGTSGTIAFSGTTIEEVKTSEGGTATYKYVGPNVTPDETLFFSIDNTNAFTSVVINGESSPTPSYSVEADQPSYDEGETITYTINTTNVIDNTRLYYTLSGSNITASDFTSNILTGSFVVVNNTATVEVIVSEDLVAEETELLTFTIDNTTASENVIINGQITTTTDTDEELNPVFLATYAIESDKTQYNEGETIIYTVTTTNVPNGTLLSYTLFGPKITQSDLTNGSLSGSFVIVENTAKIYVGIAEDKTFEGSDVLTIVVNNTNASTQVTIVDENVKEDEKIPDILEPCYEAPTFGTPITDGKGSIISIPIKKNGCPYQQPPKIIVTGSGYGASAIALLDSNGLVSEVRVTRGGVGYKKNTSLSLNLECVIDSFTLLNPGRGYTSVPDVYVNGQLGLARAKINEKGFVYSVEIIDRITTYESLPQIVIQGGGGSGARVIASLTCLDSIGLERNGYAKIGTGKYIDCP